MTYVLFLLGYGILRKISVLLFSLILFGAFGLAAFSMGAAQSQHLTVFTVPTRQGVTVKGLLVMPTGTPKGVLLLFIGGAGTTAFGNCCQGDTVNYNSNFLSASTPLFTAQGYAVFLVNAPSDQPNGMSPDFRLSSANVQDISMVVDFLLSKSLNPIILVGTSRGTISVESFASANPKDSRIAGIVLTSSYSPPELQILVKGATLSVQSITLPVIFVHNVYDACSETPFQNALDFSKLFTSSAKVNFIQVQDKVSGPGGSDPDPCGPGGGHGYHGIESQVVSDITDWASQVISQSQSQAISPTTMLITIAPNSKPRINSELYRA